jgi:hypothetical protein
MATFGCERRACALISPYSAPNEHLLQTSHSTLVVCRYQGDAVLWVVDARSILSVVAMVPFPFLIDGHDNYYYMIEKIGLDVIEVDEQENNVDEQ